ncbi:DUF4199 domain-containing protein [Mucilaginibacter terrae]|uniref:NADH:ubiquinone oxidoreductase subunit K n=1 Tax=Mucilaginibacter terrae TaxID=1955052 RepID=A0ABU3GV48_9SPHI|nr:DUF4199 domain-containing protein [Mucilaginibacter terrae]MDT3403653.1 NADH:ubiquinone oxidoreductase subunit K [Mucilaginibacter terrae]
MKKTIWVFGLIAGVIVAGFMTASGIACYNNPNYEGSMLLGYTGMLIAFSFAFVGVKNYRDKYNNGYISFLQALKIAALITFIGCTVYVGVWLIEYYFFMPDFMDNYVAHVIKQAKDNGATAAEIKAQMEDMKGYQDMYKTPFGVILMTYLEPLPVAILVTLATALILQRKPKNLQPVVS